MTLPFTFALALAAAVPTGLCWVALVGLGVARQGDPAAVALSATTLVFAPALAASLGGEGRTRHALLTQLSWATLLFLCLPVYFPGERREAVATGLALLTMSGTDDGLARAIADHLPDDPELAEVLAPLAELERAELLPPPARTLADHEIALPYEGEGRRLSIPVVFEHGGVQLETYMMLDTGATYTTLPLGVLRQLAAEPAEDAPVLTLSTANGERTSRVTLVDKVWLGDLEIGGVAITTCEDCAAEDHVGLLGLNVTGGYNLTIDADRREVILAARKGHDRRLDIRPFADLDGRFKRYPGGRVEFHLDLHNRAPRDVADAVARVACGASSWAVVLGAVPARGTTGIDRRLPPHEPCESYELELAEAQW